VQYLGGKRMHRSDERMIENQRGSERKIRGYWIGPETQSWAKRRSLEEEKGPIDQTEKIGQAADRHGGWLRGRAAHC
jgi:hypothetical protein